jgi:nitronate monooxygenase
MLQAILHGLLTIALLSARASHALAPTQRGVSKPDFNFNLGGEGTTMWPDRRIIDLFGIEHPLILAPMTGVGTVNLAASVCAAGGLGSVSCATLQPDLVAQTIKQLRERTDRPINANFFCHVQAKSDAQREQVWRERLSRYYRELGIGAELQRPHFDIAPFGAEMCGVVEAAKPEVVSFHFGLPEPALLARVKAAGCRVMSSATTVEEARWLEAHGVDVIIAQGNEAGGHRGMFLSPDPNTVIASQPGIFALVPLVADAVKVPVVAAGGIADARGIAAAFALGASGVQIGTGYLLCPEAATSNFHRDAIRHARVDSTVVSNIFTGRPARVLASRLSQEIGPMLDAAPDFPLPLGALLPLISKAEQRDINDFTPLWSGEAAALASDLPGQRLTVELAKGAIERFRQLGCGANAA